MTQADESQRQEILDQRCLEAVQAVENVLTTPPQQRRQMMDFGERAVVQLRDGLIERCRQENPPEVQARLKTALNQANIALSLITGVEYPGAGIQEATLQMARDVLKEIKV